MNRPDKQSVTGYINSYTAKTRDIIREMKTRLLARYGLEDRVPMLVSCVDELVKNAIKANYKFVMIHDLIRENLEVNNPGMSREDLDQYTREIIFNPETYNAYAERILDEFDLGREVRRVLDQEAVYIDLKNKAYRENRELTHEEKENLSRYTRFRKIRKRIRELDITVSLTMSMENGFMNINVSNSSPILMRDIRRINDKRNEFNTCRRQGREHEFFISNLDTSEAGFGLGYATIDSIIASWGLDPEESMYILTSSDTTVLLTLPMATKAKMDQGYLYAQPAHRQAG